MIAGLNRHRHRHRHRQSHRHRHRHRPSQLVRILLVQTPKLKMQAQVLQKALLPQTKSTRWKSKL